jgi:hypothetical protein
MNLDPYLRVYAKINSKWIIDQNVRLENVKCQEEILDIIFV